MNKQDADILLELCRKPHVNQRELARETGWSLGIVNKALKNLTDAGLINADGSISAEGADEVERCRPTRAVILAAGFGMRMVPINMTTPKALLMVNGERLIERLIRQLNDAGIRDIEVVAGFMKDQFEFLIDKYDVKLIVNQDYGLKNNLHSMALAAAASEKRARRSGTGENVYIVPCDLWCDENPFRRNELYSWYMMADSADPDSGVRINRKDEVVRLRSGENGQRMVGISYFLADDWAALKGRLLEMDKDHRYDEVFWEEALFPAGQDRMEVYARTVSGESIVEINTYEQLRELDSGSNHLHSEAIRVIAECFGVSEREIVDISVLKKGMTNRSFLFSVKGDKYIMRIPGEGTDFLINRKQEAAVFKAISGKGLCDDPVLILPEKGYKITKYLDQVRVCDADSEDDLRKCMKLLRHFHEMNIQVEHTFDIFAQIDFYESLWEGEPSIYTDYEDTKKKVLELKAFVENEPHEWSLTHIDAVPDNFLFYQKDGKEELQLTDWEYSGMQDPHVDIAMFGIYVFYDRPEMDHLIDIYFDGKASDRIRARIYCYVAICGLLWSNWCEYKRKLGVEFGEYSLRQYRYAKEFYRYAKELIEKIK